MAPVYVWHEDIGSSVLLLDAPAQLAVQGDMKRLAAMGAGGCYFGGEALVA